MGTNFKFIDGIDMKGVGVDDIEKDTQIEIAYQLRRIADTLDELLKLKLGGN